MIPKEIVLYAEQNSDFTYTIPSTLDDSTVLDLVNGSFSGMTAKSYTSATKIELVFNIVNNACVMSLSKDITKTMSDTRYVFDVFYNLNSNKRKIIKGVIVVSPSLF